MIFGKISSDDLRLLLELWPSLEEEVNDLRPMLAKDIEGVLASHPPQVSWCQFYELSFAQHVSRVMSAWGLTEEMQTIGKAPSAIQETARLMAKVDEEFSASDEVLSKEEAEQLLPGIFVGLGLSLSVYNSLRSLMTFGLSLNDLVGLVRAGGSNADAALFNALKIDPAVLGCPSVSSRLSRAVLVDDQTFFEKLRRALVGKLAKREDKTYQKMRLILHVLSDCGAKNLSGDQLNKLFVEELGIYSRTVEGDPTKALRKFANQYMKAASTT